MAWDDERYERFVDAVGKMARGELPGYGYPHVIVPYHPTDELRCIAETRRLPARLSQQGLSVEPLPVAPFVAHALRRFAERGLPEKEDYHRLELDLASTTDGVIASVVDRIRRDGIAKAPASAVLVFCRLGALYPFAHVSAFLAGRYRAGVENTIGVLYPGTASGMQLKFLGLDDPTGGYRGHIVT
jgi:hypothetical protein